MRWKTQGETDENAGTFFLKKRKRKVIYKQTQDKKKEETNRCNDMLLLSYTIIEL